MIDAMDYLHKLNISPAGVKRAAVNLLMISIGAFIAAISINALVIPYHLITGGVSGLAIILKYVINTPVYIMILVLNVPIFWWGYREINKRFLFYSLAGTILLSAMLPITRNLITVPKLDMVLVAIFGGVLNGIGFGLIFKFQGSTGGTDIIAVVMRKKKNLGLGEVAFYSNLIIIVISLLFFPVETGLYTIISIFVAGKVVDSVITGLNTNKSVIIISEQTTHIADRIINEMHRGVTFFSGHGAYLKKQKSVLNCVINRFELARLKEIVLNIDPNAFMYISDASEVLGKGFTGQNK
ncbi:YitT family protein [Desulfotruncus alcoholivorax]|uniref:YitT family protein n=1 Tax=Desulfotruncus alcoholivorax TaxID=265477 RepID=UPI000416C5C0|nr:YitT family protein [Desulfotruncus alcoholivorax]